MKNVKEKMAEAFKNNIQSSGGVWDIDIAAQAALDVVCEELASKDTISAAEKGYDTCASSVGADECHLLALSTALKAAADKLRG